MQPLLIKDRYRVIQILEVQQDYASVKAVDIEDKEQTEYIINIYEGELRKPFIRCFADLKNCSEYQLTFTQTQSICSVFTLYEGPTIDDVFYLGAEHDWQTRLYFAEELFHLGLTLIGEPPELACAAFLSKNIVVKLHDESLHINYVLTPMEGVSEREMIWLLSDQIKKVLIRRWQSASKEHELLDILEDGRIDSMVSLYSYWLKMKLAIEAQHTAIDKKSWFSKKLYWLFQNIARLFRRKRR